MRASSRIQIGHALVAGFVFLAISVGNSAIARADVLATFTSATSNDYDYTGGATTSTLVTSPTPLVGSVKYGPTFYTPVGPDPATISLSASSTTAASGITQGGWSGSYTIADGGKTLTVSFTNATLIVVGGSASLLGSATITANFGAPIAPPESFGITLSGVGSPTLGSFGFSNFSGSDSSTASATVGSLQAVPEPSSLAIAGIGALGLLGYGLRRRKALGV